MLKNPLLFTPKNKGIRLVNCSYTCSMGRDHIGQLVAKNICLPNFSLPSAQTSRSSNYYKFFYSHQKKKKPTKEVILLLKDLMANHIIVNLVMKILSQLYQLLTYEYKIDLSRQEVFGLCFQITIFSF